VSDVKVSGSLVIPDAELEETFSTSGGPGGQHANRSSTRVQLAWNVRTSAVLNEQQRQKLLNALKNRIDSDGVLRMVAASSRSQSRNRKEAEQRLAKVVASALKTVPRRVATRPTRAAQERRLQSKKRRAETKRDRRTPDQ
jgi:ribosome-associated protein